MKRRRSVEQGRYVRRHSGQPGDRLDCEDRAALALPERRRPMSSISTRPARGRALGDESSSPGARRCWCARCGERARSSGRRPSRTTSTATTSRWHRLWPTARSSWEPRAAKLGVRGFVAAYEPDTGRQLWKVFTVPAPGEAWERNLAAGGDQWKTGGGSIWVTANYDPSTKLASGHRQRRNLDGQSAAGRQPVHLVDDSDRRDNGKHQGP